MLQSLDLAKEIGQRKEYIGKKELVRGWKLKQHVKGKVVQVEVLQ